MKMPVWSEYKVTFCKTNTTTLDFLFSKGYYPSEMNFKHFMFDPFQNYKSCDLEKSHIGMMCDKEIKYIPEERFNSINKALDGISFDMFEYAFSKQEKDAIVILKRGIYLRFNTTTKSFIIDCGSPFGHVYFSSLQGDEKMCRLDLVKILEDERIGWVPVPEVIDLTPDTPRLDLLESRLDLLESVNKKFKSHLDVLINMESENNKNIVDMLSRLDLLESVNKKFKSHLDVVINMESENNKNIDDMLSRVNNMSELIDIVITETEDNKTCINELTEHNKQLSSRLCDVENMKVPPPIILM